MEEIIEIVIIRHAKTEGNKYGRYIGKTDEHLCIEGIEIVKKKDYPIHNVEKVYVSPLLRCIETAGIIFNNRNIEICENLKECNFGIFENKNYNELKDNILYQKWIDSNGKIDFPEGEAIEDFKERVKNCFEEIIKDIIDNSYLKVALVVHGGTIMSILDEYSKPHKDYYSWRVKNGEGFFLLIDEELWKNNKREIYIKKKL